VIEEPAATVVEGKLVRLFIAVFSVRAQEKKNGEFRRILPASGAD